MFYVAYRTLLVMICVLKFYFVDFYGMFYIFSNMASENVCALQSREKYHFSKTKHYKTKQNVREAWRSG